MEETLISFEIAKLAKEKGFDEITYYIYDINIFNTIGDLIENMNGLKHSDGNNYFISAPTQSLLQKWLREVHSIDITVITNWRYGLRTYRVGFSYILNDSKIDIWFSKEDGFKLKEYNTYEEALEAGLQEALKQIN